MIYMQEGFCFTVEKVNATVSGSHPKPAFRIFINVLDIIIGEGIGIGTIMPVNDEMIAIVTVQSILSSEPHESITILHDAVDHAL